MILVHRPEPFAPLDPLPPIVLVVDRDADTRAMYESAFGLAGLWMGHADEPADALNYAMELRPDAVVIDVRASSSEDALSLAHELRENPRTADTPLVAVSSVAGFELEPGARVFSEFFSKPVPLPIFVRHVRWRAARAAILHERSARARTRELPAEPGQGGDPAAIQANLAAAPIEVRLCPGCRRPLDFVERQLLDGVQFDYYVPCPSGCGLFCYDHSRRQFVRFLQ